MSNLLNHFFDNEEPKSTYQQKITVYEEIQEDFSELSDDSLIESDTDIDENIHGYNEILDEIVNSIIKKEPFSSKTQKSKCSNCKTSNSKEWFVGPKGYNSLCEECGTLYYKGKIELDETGKNQVNVDEYIVDKKRKRQSSVENIKKKKYEFTDKEKEDLINFFKKEIEEFEKIQPEKINSANKKFNIDRTKLTSFIQYHRKDCECNSSIHQKKTMISN